MKWVQSLWQTEITCQGKGTWGEGNTDRCTITFIQWRVSTPAPLKSVNIKEIWHYPLNYESLSQTLLRPDCFILQKESWRKPQLVSKKRNRNLRKHLCSRRNGFRRKHICRPHFAPFGALQLPCGLLLPVLIPTLSLSSTQVNKSSVRKTNAKSGEGVLLGNLQFIW